MTVKLVCDFDIHYIKARYQTDFLCRRIIRRQISASAAQTEMQRIATEYARACPEKAELFNMIYQSRIDRLCRQFLQGSDDGI